MICIYNCKFTQPYEYSSAQFGVFNIKYLTETFCLVKDVLKSSQQISGRAGGCLVLLTLPTFLPDNLGT